VGKQRLPYSELMKLQRWNTPSVHNGWRQITKHNAIDRCINIDETKDFMPEMGPMVGYAVTVIIEPSNPEHRQNKQSVEEYRRYVASVPGPKIVVVQDLDSPKVEGSFWGEINANLHKALGCIGTITDGAIRDLDEMRTVRFKALARRLCVGNAYVTPVRWGCEVEVFGAVVRPGQLIHADKHGFLMIPDEDSGQLLDATVFMDANECQTLLPVIRQARGKTSEEVLDLVDQAAKRSVSAIKAKFSGTD